ncbi:MAG: TraB/GumN family protein [Bacteroidota bacterium]
MRSRETDRLSAYLFGTMHVNDPRVLALFENVKPYIDACDAFATEIDLNGPIPDPQYFMIPDCKTFYDFIKPKKYQKLNRISKKAFGLNLDMHVQKMPLLIISIISEALLSNQDHPPLDKHLSDYAASSGKKMLGVEDLLEHMEVLQKIPIEFQIKAMTSILSNVSSFRRKMQMMTEQYLQQEIYKLYKAAKKSLQDSRQVMLYERNYKMAASIVEMSKDQKSFIAVGAAHLAGKTGLLKLLKDEGFRLNPIVLKTNL